MNHKEDFNDLYLCPVNGHDLLPPRFTDVLRHSFVEHFNPVGDFGVTRDRFHYYEDKLCQGKRWRDVMEEAMDGVVSILEMRRLLNTYMNIVKDIVVDHHSSYVERMAVFTFYLHFFVDNTRMRNAILQFAIDGISSANVHRLYNCAEDIRRALPPYKNFFPVEFDVLNDVGVGFQYAGIENVKPTAEIPNQKVLANVFPANSASNAGDDTESDICVSQDPDTQEKEKISIHIKDLEDHQEVYLNTPSETCNKQSPELSFLQEYEDTFGDVSEFSDLENKILSAAYHSSENILINSDLSLNKKNIVSLAIMKIFIDYGKPMSQEKRYNLFSRPKVIYLVSSDVMAVYTLLENLNKIFPKASITSCYISSKDSKEEKLLRADIIITTLEILYYFTCKNGFVYIFNKIGLLILDDFASLWVQCGSLLETIILRIRSLVSNSNNLRVISFMPSLLPVECKKLYDFCKFLNVNPSSGLFVSDMCSVGVYGVKLTPKSLIKILCTVLEQVFTPDCKNVILFSQSQTSGVWLARQLVYECESLNEGFPVQWCLEEEILSKMSSDQRHFFDFGILLLDENAPLHVRKSVMSLFNHGAAKILISTYGAVCDCKLVVDTVIFDDLFYDADGSLPSKFQMMDAVSQINSQQVYFVPLRNRTVIPVILTDDEIVDKYTDLLFNPFSNVQSQILETLRDIVCSEVCIGNLCNFSHVVEWFKSTYYYISRKEKFELQDDSSMETVDIASDGIKEMFVSLEEERMIEPNWREKIIPTAFGYISNDYNVGIELVHFLVESIEQTSDNFNLSTAWDIVCKLPEFSTFKAHNCNFGYSERSLEPLSVKNNNRDCIESVESSLKEIIQTYLSEKHVPENLKHLFPQIIKKVQNVANALLEICLHKKNSVMSYCFLQLLQYLNHESYTADNNLSPKFKLKVCTKTLSSTTIEVTVFIVPEYSWIDGVPDQRSEGFYIWIDNGNNLILAHKTLVVTKYHVENKVCLEVVFVLNAEPLFDSCCISLGSHFWPGCFYIKNVNLQFVTMPRDFLEYTEIRSVSKKPCVNIDSYINKAVESAYLCPVVSNVFYNLTAGDENMLIASSCCHHRPISAELAMVTSLRRYPTMKVIYVSARGCEVAERFKEWKCWLNDNSVQVNVLTGSMSADLEIFSKNDVILASSKDFEMATRFFEIHEYFSSRQVRLLIFDCIDIMDSYMEIGVKRVKYFQGRIIAISRFTLKNVEDISSFFYMFRSFTYNFHGSSTCVQHLFPDLVEVKHCPRAAIINDIVWEIVCKNLSKYRSLLIVVPSTTDALKTAYALLLFLQKCCYKPPVWAKCEEKIVNKVNDVKLKSVLSHGIGFCHPTMSREDCLYMQELINSHRLQVLIVTSDMMDILTFRTELVIVKETEYFNSDKQQLMDLPNSTLLNILASCYSSTLCTGVCNYRKIFILTSRVDLQSYSSLVDGVSVESQLLNNLPQFLNADICSKPLYAHELQTYINSLYIFRRANANPSYYSIENTSSISTELIRILQDSLNMLHKLGCIDIDQTYGRCSSLEFGSVMMTSGLSFFTMESLSTSVTDNMSMESILLATFQTNDISSLYLTCGRFDTKDLPRLSGKECLIKLDMSSIPPSSRQAFHLLQAHLSHCNVRGIGFSTDQHSVINIVKSILQVILHISLSRHYVNTTVETLLLLQMIRAGRWGGRLSALPVLPHVYSFSGNVSRMMINVVLNNVPSHTRRECDFLAFRTFVDQAAECDLRVEMKRSCKTNTAWNFLLMSETNNCVFSFRKTNSTTDQFSFKFVVPNTKGDHFYMNLYMIAEDCIGLDQQIRMKVDIYSPSKARMPRVHPPHGSPPRFDSPRRSYRSRESNSDHKRNGR